MLTNSSQCDMRKLFKHLALHAAVASLVYIANDFHVTWEGFLKHLLYHTEAEFLLHFLPRAVKVIRAILAVFLLGLSELLEWISRKLLP